MIAFFVQAKNVHHLEWNLCIMSIVEIITDKIQHSRSSIEGIEGSQPPGKAGPKGQPGPKGEGR